MVKKIGTTLHFILTPESTRATDFPKAKLTAIITFSNIKNFTKADALLHATSKISQVKNLKNNQNLARENIFLSAI
jgi:hypothetical protein